MYRIEVFMSIGAVVLAAGEGKRYGGNKLIAEFKGKPIILRVIDALEGIERVVIVGKYAQELLPLLKNEIVIYNPYWEEGMSTSIKLGVKFFQEKDGILIVLGDMPLITKDTIQKIISAFREECEAVIPIHEGKQGNPVIISKKLYNKLFELQGDVGARYILKNLKNPCHVNAGKEVLVDIDTINDLLLFSQKPL